MGKTLDVHEAVRLAAVELRSKRTLEASMLRLERAAGVKTGIDFATDARSIAAEVQGLVAKLRPKATGLCFFLDGDAIARGRGIEVLAGPGYDSADTELEWAFDTKRAGRIASAALRKAYETISENPAEYAVCFGYLGLALRDALRAVGPSPVVRGIAWGYHGGDFFLLGELTPKGFALAVRLEKEAEPVVAIAAPQLPAAPEESRSPRDWLVRAGLVALGNTTRLDGVGDAFLSARDLQEIGANADAVAIARAAGELASTQRGTRNVADNMVVGYLADCAEILGRAGARDDARVLIDRGCTWREGLSEYWKENAARALTDAARASDSLDLLRRHEVPIEKLPAPEKEPPPRSTAAMLAAVTKELARGSALSSRATFSSLLRLGEELHERQDRESLAKLTKRADEQAAAWKLEKGWDATASLADLAVLHFLLGDGPGTLDLLLRAERAGASERGASSKKTVMTSLLDAFEAVGQPDRPFTAFRAPPSPSRDVASAVRRGALDEVNRRIAQESDPSLRADLLRNAAATLQAAIAQASSAKEPVLIPPMRR